MLIMRYDFTKFLVNECIGVFQVYSTKGTIREIFNRASSGFLIATKGSITYFHNGKRYICDKNNILFIPQGLTYHLECNEDDISYVINFNSNVVGDYIEQFNIDVDLLTKQIDKFYYKYDRNDSNYQVNKCVLLYKIVSNLISSEENKYPLLVEKAIKYIKLNISNPNLKNSDIARHCLVSIIYLQKLFAKHLNKGLKEYILKLRMLKAEEYLLNSDLPIYEIASLTGFTSSINFTRSFKLHHNNLTALQYRKSNLY